MDKQQEAQAAAVGDSISSVGVPVKDYAPSEVYTNEPPPAYKKPRATSVQIARLAAATVVACTTILGVCIIASAWIQANASCSQLIHAEALLHQQQQNDDVVDRPSYQALVDPLQSDESSESKQESIVAVPASQHREHSNNVASHPAPPSPPSPSAAQQSSHSTPFDSQSIPIQIKLPLQLDFDDFAGNLMEKNQRSRMNCVVEKKRAEEVMDHQPKTVRLPFGVNITTDPRYEHVTGERMTIYCESGQDQRHLPMETMQQQQSAPVVVPMPVNVPMMVPPPAPQPNHQHLMQQQQAAAPHINHIPLSMITRAVAAQEEQQQQQQQSMAAAQMQKDDSPITIIAREEHVIPIFQQIVPEIRQVPDMRHIAPNPEIRNVPEKVLYHPAAPEGRMLHAMAIPEARHNMVTGMDSRNMHHQSQAAPSMPADMVRPPPPPAFHKVPIHVPTFLQQIENQQQQQQQQQVIENTLDEEMETEPRPHFVQPRSVRSVDVDQSRDKRPRRYACQCTS